MQKQEDKYIESIIRKSYLKDGVKALIYTCFLAIFFFGLLYYSIQSLEYNILISILLFALCIFSAILIKTYMKSILQCWHYFTNYTEIPVFKLYGDLSSLFQEINKNKVYEDNQVIISTRFIVSKKDYRIINKLDTILGIYISQHKTNTITDRFSLVICNQFGEDHYIDYKASEKENVNTAMTILARMCANAKLGYNSETLQYVKDNVKD